MLGLDITSNFFVHVIMDYLVKVQRHISVEQRIYVREEMLYLSFDMGASPYIGKFASALECSKFRSLRRCTPETLCGFCVALGVLKKLYNEYLKRITLYGTLKKVLYDDL